MAKKKTTKKKDSVKKSTNKKTIKKKEKNTDKTIVIETDILKRIVDHFKRSDIKEIILITIKDMDIAKFVGICESTIIMSCIELCNIEVDNSVMIFSVKRLEKLLAVSKKLISILSENSSATIKSGKLAYKMSLKPVDDDTVQFLEFLKRVEETKSYDSFFSCIVDPKDFKDIISVAKTLDFAETMYFEQDDSTLKISLLETDKIDEIGTSVEISDIKSKGNFKEDAIACIKPKYIKSFEVFDNEFLLTIPENDPVIVEMNSEIGDYQARIWNTIAQTRSETSSDEIIEDSDDDIIVEDLGDEKEPTEEIKIDVEDDDFDFEDDEDLISDE